MSIAFLLPDNLLVLLRLLLSGLRFCKPQVTRSNRVGGSSTKALKLTALRLFLCVGKYNIASLVLTVFVK